MRNDFRSFWRISLALIFGVIAGQAESVPVPAGVVGWWRAEGNNLDAIGNGAVEVPGGASFVPGMVGQAFSFAGGATGVLVGIPPAFQLQDFTIEAWIKRSSATASSQFALAGALFAGGPNSYGLALESNGQLSVSKVGVSKVSSTGKVADTAWHHVAVTKGGANVHFYIDGADAGSGEYNPTFTFETPFAVGSLGAPVNANNFTFFGLIDEASLYTHPLSAVEIKGIYTAGADGKGAAGIIGSLKATAPGRVAGGTDFRTRFFLKNEGSIPATNLALSVSLPAGYHLESGAATFGAVTVNGATVQDAVASLPPGETVTLTLTGYGDAPADLTFQGQVTRDGLLGGLAHVTTSTLVSIGATIPDGIVGWWRAEGDNQDVFRNGTTNATSTYIAGASFVPGFVGQAFSFGGGLIGVRVGNPVAFQQQDVTIEAWVKRASATAASESYPAGVIFAGGSGSYSLAMEAAGQLSFGKVGVSKVSSTAKVTDTLWHHVAVTKQATSVSFYIDGNPAGAASYGETFTFTTPFAIGSLGTTVAGNNYTFWGLIDETGLYLRALSAGEIGAIYGASNSGKRAENIVLRVDAPPAVPPGADFTVTYTVFNAGIDAARNVVLGANLPAALAVVGNTASQGGNSIAGTTLTNRLGTLLPGETAVISLTGHANAPATLVFDGQITRTGGDLLLVDNQAASSVEILGPCAPIPSDGLVVWLPGDGNAKDVFSHPVTYSGTNFVPGRVNQAFDFDGKTGEVSIPDSPDLDQASFTAEAWVFPTALDGTVETIVTKETYPHGATDIQFLVGIKGPLSSIPNTIPTGNLMFFVSGISGVPSNFGSYADAHAAIPLNQWSHVALTLGGGTIKVYVNGVVTFRNSSIRSPVMSSGPLRIGSRDSAYIVAVPQDRFNGHIDEFSYYSRALTEAEIASIYQAGGAGKCVPAVLPSIVAAPTNQAVQVGNAATFSVVARGTDPLTYQWKFKGTDIPDATNATLTVPVQHLSDAGTYGVSVCNAAGCAPLVTAELKVIPLPATVNVVSVSAQSQQNLEVPVRLIGSGLENALSFSLQFDPNRLTYLDTGLGTDVTGGQIRVDTGKAGQGTLGISLTLPAGATLAEGTNDVLHLHFAALPVTVSLTTSVAFVNSPTAQKLSDIGGGALPATWNNGFVAIAAPALEGDVNPLPDGDGVVSVTDAAQVGRYVAGLDDLASGPIFQRADCAPLASSGDGVLSVSDWVEAARFAAGRDLPGLADGPLAPLTFIPAPPSADRVIHLGAATLTVGEIREIPVLLAASGEENAVGFSVTYNPAELTFVSAINGAGSQQAGVLANGRSAQDGRIGVVVALNAASRFPAGSVEIARLRFVATGAPGTSASLAFGDAPVVREVATSFAEPLPVSWQGASFSVTSAACVPSPDGLSVWLRGEGSPEDALGHSASGTGVDYVPGRVGQAIRFPGTGGVAVSDSADLDRTNFTVETWVYPTALRGLINTIASKTLSVVNLMEGRPPRMEYDSYAQFGLGINGQGNLAFSFGSIAGTGDPYALWRDGQGAVPLNQWTHVALTLNSGTVTVYVNGAVTLRATGLTAGPVLNTEPLRLGFVQYAGNIGIDPQQDSFTGLIDEFSYYSRPLSDAEITAIYLAGAKGKCEPGEPVVTARRVTTPDGPAIELSWPAGLAGASLETAEVPGGGWTAVTVTPTVVDGQNTVVLPLSASASYFRLKLP
jgi:uncharacterized repeat protein (TIGR01451 family)